MPKKPIPAEDFFKLKCLRNAYLNACDEMEEKPLNQENVWKQYKAWKAYNAASLAAKDNYDFSWGDI